jgi:hypothetical protein
VHQERAIFDLLDGMATKINEAGTNARIKLEYQGGRLNLAVESADQQIDAGPALSAGDEIERVTIRLPAHLKRAIDEAAVSSGMSINTWYIRTLARALAFRGIHGRGHGEPGVHHGGRRGRGRRMPGGDDVD